MGTGRSMCVAAVFAVFAFSADARWNSLDLREASAAEGDEGDDDGDGRGNRGDDSDKGSGTHGRHVSFVNHLGASRPVTIPAQITIEPGANMLSVRLRYSQRGAETPTVSCVFVNALLVAAAADGGAASGTEPTTSVSSNAFLLKSCTDRFHAGDVVVADTLTLRITTAQPATEIPLELGLDVPESLQSGRPGNPGIPTTVRTHHNNNSRTGSATNLPRPAPRFFPAYRGFTVNTITENPFGELFCWPVDGQVFAQPLYIERLPMTKTFGVCDGESCYVETAVLPVNAVFIATTNNTVYAFDADDIRTATTGDPAQGDCPMIVHGAVWERHFEAAAPADNNAGTGNGNVGIIGTPVIDNDLVHMYFVTRTGDSSGKCGAPSNNPNTLESDDSHCFFFLHVVDVRSGDELVAKAPIVPEIQATPPHAPTRLINFSAMAGAHIQRPALLLAGGVVYVGFAATQFDAQCHEYHGWLVGYDAATLVQRSVFVTSPRSWGGGIWQSGNGPASDFLGHNLFMLSGNSNGVPLPAGGPAPGCAKYGLSNPAVNQSTSCSDYGSPDCSGDGQPLDFEDSLIGLPVDPNFQSGFGPLGPLIRFSPKTKLLPAK